MPVSAADLLICVFILPSHLTVTVSVQSVALITLTDPVAASDVMIAAAAEVIASIAMSAEASAVTGISAHSAEMIAAPAEEIVHPSALMTDVLVIVPVAAAHALSAASPQHAQDVTMISDKEIINKALMI